jgi:hypothetical protein
MTYGSASSWTPSRTGFQPVYGAQPNAVNYFGTGNCGNCGVEKHEKTNPKSQTNSNSQIRNPKRQVGFGLSADKCAVPLTYSEDDRPGFTHEMTKRKRVSDIEFWDLLFVWNLFFVICDFAADAVHPAEMLHGVGRSPIRPIPSDRTHQDECQKSQPRNAGQHCPQCHIQSAGTRSRPVGDNSSWCISRYPRPGAS